MAIRIPNQHPLDINKRVAVGIAIPFNGTGTSTGNLLFTGSAGSENLSPTYSTGNSIFRSTYTTIEQTKYNIINFILTDKNERVLNPNFGGNLRAFLFSNITSDNLQALELKLSNDIQNNFPNVTLTNLTLTPYYDDNAIQLDIVFTVYNGVPQNIQILL
jgi:phage baseplate assembly protein W